MVYSLGVQNNKISNYNQVPHAEAALHAPFKYSSAVSFGDTTQQNKSVPKEPEYINNGRLLYDEQKKHPIRTNLGIQANKLKNAFTTYPKKGFEGSKNANFYEFLTMGTVPYLIGSAMLIGVFNFASRFYDNSSAISAGKLGKKMGIGVISYGLLKTLSKKLIEIPVKMKYGIDVNMMYDKKIDELPEERNKNNLVAHEPHKVYESVDFPFWNLLYDNESFGPERTSYFKNIAKKFNIKEEDMEYADQKMKPKIIEKVIQTRLFSTLSSYLWAATGVAIAMQKPWENLKINPMLNKSVNNFKTAGKDIVKGSAELIKDFGHTVSKSCYELVNNSNRSVKIAGRLLLGSAIGMTLLGNFSTLFDFNKDRGTKTQAASSLINDKKEKVVC